MQPMSKIDRKDDSKNNLRQLFAKIGRIIPPFGQSTRNECGIRKERRRRCGIALKTIIRECHEDKYRLTLIRERIMNLKN